MMMLNEVRRLLSDLAARRRHRRSERIIAALPVEILKDIGWPGCAGGLPERRRRKRA